MKSGKWLLLGSTCPRYEGEGLVRYVLSTLRDDEIASVIKKDSFILQLGNCKLQKLGTKKAPVVRQEIRQAARLLIELRRITDRSRAPIADFLNPGSFDLVVMAVKNICVQLEKLSLNGAVQFEKPALALKIGQSVKRLVCLKEGFAIQNQDSEARTESEDFLKLYHREWCDRVNSHAFQTLNERKYNCAELLPLTEDLKKLKEHHISHMADLVQKMKFTPTADGWRKLALLTLGRVSIFNKRGEAEVDEVLLTAYIQSKSLKPVNDDLLQGLSDFEKQLCSSLHHLEVIGKQRRKVPIVLTHDMLQAIDALVESSAFANARQNNPYLFPNGGTSHLKTSQALKFAAKEACLLHPELVTSTKLRKYMATVSQVVSLSENELEYLANHMGHSIMVHRNYYRLQDSAVELTKVSRLLMAAEEGKLGSLAGKQLDDITFSDLPDYCEKEECVAEKCTEVQPGPSGDENVTAENGVPPVENGAPATVVLPETDEGGLYEDGEVDEVTKLDTGQRCKEKPVRTSWTSEEMVAISGLIQKSVFQRKPPNKECALDCLRQHPVLGERAWKAVKFRVWAEAQKLIRKENSVKSSLLSK